MKVSVIVPVYNAGKYLERCVTSLLEQTYDDLQLIFVDDKSTDNSLELLHSLLDNASCEVKILANEQNSGCSASRRRGMKAATGDYIINIDSDDYVSPRFVELMAAKAMECGSDVVVCDVMYCYGDRQALHHITPEQDTRKVMCRVLSGQMHAAWWNKLIKRSLIEEHDLYPVASVTLCEDKVVMVPILYYASRIDYVAQPLYYYNKAVATAMTSQAKAKSVDSLLTVTRYFDTFFADKQLDKQCQQSINHHKALVLGHVLLYGTRDDVEVNHSLFSSLTVSDIISHPTAPLHYKASCVAHKYHLQPVISMLRMALRVAGRT